MTTLYVGRVFDERRGSYLGPKGCRRTQTTARPVPRKRYPGNRGRWSRQSADEVQNDDDEENVGMNSKATKADTKRTELKHSRAALWTIQHAVDAVANSIRQLKTLQGHVYVGYRGALSTLQMARHHSLNDRDLNLVEDCVGKLAQRADWPATMRSRTRHESLERPLSDTESSVVTSLVGSALAVSAGTLDITEYLDALYGGLAVTAAAAARSAYSVTAETHRKRADKLMLRLDQLCANQRIAWAFTAGAENQPSIFRRTLH